MRDLMNRVSGIHGAIERDLADLPQFKRGLLFCHTCGKTEPIRGGEIRNGWPKCCGYTMSLDSPEERKGSK